MITKRRIIYLFSILLIITLSGLVSAAFTASYEQPTRALGTSGLMWRTSSGGTVFTSIPYNAVAFDYFDDDAVVDDAFYYSVGGYNSPIAGLRFNVGTEITAGNITLVWEYYDRTYNWVPIVDIIDATSNFSITGVNDVKFPQQWRPKTLSVNGGTNRGTWVRCRITAVTNITEGGANQIDDVTYGRGVLTVSGTTDEVPATFTEIYDWIRANEPHISVTKTNGNIFDFTKVGLDVTSRIYTTNEVIELGTGSLDNGGQGYNSFDYLTSGIKKDDVTGYGGSTFIIHGTNNQGVFDIGGGAKIYGSVLRSGKTSADSYKYPGYTNFNGEWIDCTVELSTRMPGAGSIVSNVRIVGGLVIAGSIAGVYSGVHYLCTASTMLYVYKTGFDLPNFGYAFKGTTGTVFYLYQSTSPNVDYTWKLLNPSTPLNTLSAGIKPLKLTKSTPAISQLWYYDESAGTYTDYTAEAADDVADDVPLDGDVGDMYYFGMTSVASSAVGMGIYIEKPTVNNDYVYKWEYYEGGIWREVNKVFDSSDNLGQTGHLLVNVNDADNVAINGISKDYLRATIMTKGAGSPTATKVKQSKCSGIGKWHLKEMYSFDLKVVDKNGVAIEGVTVTATDENDVEIFSVTTEENGTIASQEILVKHWYFDPENNPSTFISENIYSTATIKIAHQDYSSREFKFTLDKKIDWTIDLESRVWNYSDSLSWKILNQTDTTILKLTDSGDLAIAGELYENTNSPPPTVSIIYKLKNLFWLSVRGDLYISKKLMELI